MRLSIILGRKGPFLKVLTAAQNVGKMRKEKNLESKLMVYDYESNNARRQRH